MLPPMPSIDEASDHSRATVILGFSLWPAVLVTLLTGLGFAGLKFVLINELALSYDPAHPPALPFAWMARILQNTVANGTLSDAVSQGLAAVLTLGVLVGYAINAPLAGAWRCGWLFLISCAGVAVGTLLTLWVNAWLVAWGVGVAYGAACAARGKVIPLLSIATGRTATQVSGFINAALVIGLLAGTVAGTMLAVSVPAIHGGTAIRHLAVCGIMVVATLVSLLVRPPEPRRVPFSQGVRDLAVGTLGMVQKHWTLLVAGGLAWGIASAASLAVYIDAIDRHRLALHPAFASTLAVFAAIGAIVGNLISHYWGRRRHVISSLALLGGLLAIYPHVVHGWWSAAGMMVLIGTFFAAPANVLDARVLALASRDGQAGRGSTVMSLVHNCFIFFAGCSLSIPLFLGFMTPTEQFSLLGLAGLVAGAIVSRTRLYDRPGDMVSRPLLSAHEQSLAAASTGVAD
jgi:hypothetical protein